MFRRRGSASAGLVLASLALLAPFHRLTNGTPELALRLNVPAYRLDVIENGTESRSITVAVGMRRYPTPRGSFVVDEVEWNPWWIPPPSDWARGEKKTPPGPDNPMGRVKMRFRPLLFLHGTPFPQSLGTAASHSCIRLSNEDATALATELLEAGAPELPADTIAAMATDGGTRRVVLERPVPLEIVYELVEIRHTMVLTYRDIYGLGGVTRDAVMATLQGAGVDTLAIDTAAVRRLVRAARARPQRVFVDSLLVKESPTAPLAMPHGRARATGAS